MTSRTLADEIERLARAAAREHSDIQFYSGGSKVNVSEQLLLCLILDNHDTIVESLRQREANDDSE